MAAEQTGGPLSGPEARPALRTPAPEDTLGVGALKRSLTPLEGLGRRRFPGLYPRACVCVCVCSGQSLQRTRVGRCRGAREAGQRGETRAPGCSTGVQKPKSSPDTPTGRPGSRPGGTPTEGLKCVHTALGDTEPARSPRAAPRLSSCPAPAPSGVPLTATTSPSPQAHHPAAPDTGHRTPDTGRPAAAAALAAQPRT